MNVLRKSGVNILLFRLVPLVDSYSMGYLFPHGTRDACRIKNKKCLFFPLHFLTSYVPLVSSFQNMGHLIPTVLRCGFGRIFTPELSLWIKWCSYIFTFFSSLNSLLNLTLPLKDRLKLSFNMVISCEMKYL